MSFLPMERILDQEHVLGAKLIQQPLYLLHHLPRLRLADQLSNRRSPKWARGGVHAKFVSGRFSQEVEAIPAGGVVLHVNLGIEDGTSAGVRPQLDEHVRTLLPEEVHDGEEVVGVVQDLHALPPQRSV